MLEFVVELISFELISLELIEEPIAICVFTFISSAKFFDCRRFSSLIQYPNAWFQEAPAVFSARSKNSVLTGPGQTAVTFIFLRLSSTFNALEKLKT